MKRSERCRIHRHAAFHVIDKRPKRSVTLSKDGKTLTFHDVKMDALPYLTPNPYMLPVLPTTGSNQATADSLTIEDALSNWHKLAALRPAWMPFPHVNCRANPYADALTAERLSADDLAPKITRNTTVDDCSDHSESRMASLRRENAAKRHGTRIQCTECDGEWFWSYISIDEEWAALQKDVQP
jgi:hypothetical protein